MPPIRHPLVHDAVFALIRYGKVTLPDEEIAEQVVALATRRGIKVRVNTVWGSWTEIRAVGRERQEDADDGAKRRRQRRRQRKQRNEENLVESRRG